MNNDKVSRFIKKSKDLLNSSDPKDRAVGILLLAEASLADSSLRETAAQAAFWYWILHSFNKIDRLIWDMTRDTGSAQSLHTFMSGQIPWNIKDLIHNLLYDSNFTIKNWEALITTIKHELQPSRERDEQMSEEAWLQLGDLADFVLIITKTSKIQNEELRKEISDHRNQTTVLLCLASLSLNQKEDSIHVLRENVHHANANVRSAVMKLLGKLDSTEALEMLEQGLISDESASVPVVAAYAIANKKTDEAYEILQKAMGSNDHKTRINVVRALGSVNDEKSTQLLIQFMQEEESEIVRKTLLEAVGDSLLPRVIIVNQPPIDHLKRMWITRNICIQLNLPEAVISIDKSIRWLREKTDEQFFAAWDEVIGTEMPNHLE